LLVALHLPLINASVDTDTSQSDEPVLTGCETSARGEDCMDMIELDLMEMASWLWQSLTVIWGN
jgi:hypothetical protein